MMYGILKRFFYVYVNIYRKRISGIDNLMNLKNSGFIVAANHASYMDHLYIQTLVAIKLKCKMHFLAKKEHFENYFSRKWHEYVGAIPIDRKAGGKEALRWAIDALNKGKVVGIYPEGTRTLTGKLQRAKTGIARLALTSKVPILPIGLIGTFELMPKGKHIPKMKKIVEVHVGKPLYFNKYYGKEDDAKALREVTTIIMKEIAKLSRHEYNFD